MVGEFRKNIWRNPTQIKYWVWKLYMQCRHGIICFLESIKCGNITFSCESTTPAHGIPWSRLWWQTKINMIRKYPKEFIITEFQIRCNIHAPTCAHLNKNSVKRNRKFIFFFFFFSDQKQWNFVQKNESFYSWKLNHKKHRRIPLGKIACTFPQCVCVCERALSGSREGCNGITQYKLKASVSWYWQNG